MLDHLWIESLSSMIVCIDHFENNLPNSSSASPPSP